MSSPSSGPSGCFACRFLSSGLLFSRSLAITTASRQENGLMRAKPTCCGKMPGRSTATILLSMMLGNRMPGCGVKNGVGHRDLSGVHSTGSSKMTEACAGAWTRSCVVWGDRGPWAHEQLPVMPVSSKRQEVDVAAAHFWTSYPILASDAKVEPKSKTSLSHLTYSRTRIIPICLWPFVIFVKISTTPSSSIPQVRLKMASSAVHTA